MTDQEYKTLANKIVSLIRSESKTIGELPQASSLSDDDLFEISDGRSLSFKALKQAILDASNGGQFLSRLNDDTANGLITFVKGLVSLVLLKAKGGAEFGDFIRSMTAGKGGGIDEKGNMQVESIEVRSYALFMEMIINRLSAVESDYVFNESGTIESAEELTDGTWLITLRKRWDYDFTAFKEYDVLYGSINTLLADGSYFTSWMRVNSVNQMSNQITVSIYPDDEVPAGKNFTPCEGMNVLHRGNAIDEDRQSAWYLSSREGCIVYLEGVTKPILDEGNYYMILGKLKRLDLFSNLPINYGLPYVFARGIVVQDLLRIDYKGNPTYEIVDDGLWNGEKQYIRGYDEDLGKYIQHQVWYNSCCWRCVASEARIGVAPRYDNTDWVCIVNDNFTLKIVSSEGNVLRYGREYTTLSAVLCHGDEDVTADIVTGSWQVEWTRDSGQPSDDLAWAVSRAGAGVDLSITPSDMPSNWGTLRKVDFKVTVWVPDGAASTSMEAGFTISK